MGNDLILSKCLLSLSEIFFHPPFTAHLKGKLVTGQATLHATSIDSLQQFFLNRHAFFFFVGR